MEEYLNPAVPSRPCEAVKLNAVSDVKATVPSLTPMTVPRRTSTGLILFFILALSTLCLYWATPTSAGQAAALPEGGAIGPLALSPADPQIIYAGTYDGVFKTTNGGTRWTKIDSGLTANEILSLAVSPVNPEIVYAGTGGGGLFNSTNGGKSWTPAKTGLTSTYIRSIAIDPVNPEIAYVAASDPGGEPGRTYLNGGVFKSTNGGENWTPANSGLTTVQVGYLTIDQINPQIVYCASDRVVFKSNNGGATWAPVDYLPAYPFVSATSIASIAVDPVNPQTIYAGAAVGGAFKSTNGGKSWTKINSGLKNDDPMVGSLAISPADPQTVYAASQPGIFKSTDGGETWAPADSGLTTTGIHSLAIDPVSPQIIYAGTNGGGVFKSTDGGKSWAPANSGLRAPVRLPRHQSSESTELSKHEVCVASPEIRGTFHGHHIYARN